MSKYTFTLGGEAFPSKKGATSKIRSILNSGKFGRTLEVDEEIVVLDLLSYHPTAREKIGPGVLRIEVRSVPGDRSGRAFWLVRKDGEEVDFSYKKCISAPSQRTLLLDAMRDEVRRHIESFKSRRLGEGQICCAVTGEKFEGDIHVDHMAPDTFIVLSQAWLELRGLDELAIELKKATVGRELSDPALAEDWYKYHEEHARLQLVLPSVNLSLLRVGQA